jgi:hypothetical protein
VTSLDEKLREIAVRHGFLPEHHDYVVSLCALREAAALGARAQREADNRHFQHFIKITAGAAVIGPLVTDDPRDLPEEPL